MSRLCFGRGRGRGRTVGVASSFSGSWVVLTEVGGAVGRRVLLRTRLRASSTCKSPVVGS